MGGGPPLYICAKLSPCLGGSFVEISIGIPLGFPVFHCGILRRIDGSFARRFSSRGFAALCGPADCLPSFAFAGFALDHRNPPEVVVYLYYIEKISLFCF